MSKLRLGKPRHDGCHAEARSAKADLPLGRLDFRIRTRSFAFDESMILTTFELIATLQLEVRILLHLAGKVEGSMLSYRPAPKQRSTLELLQYMAIMGPTQLTVIEHGIFDRPTLSATWRPAEAEAAKMSFDQAVAAIGQQSDEYARRLGAWTDADFRKEVDMFGRTSSRGLLVVTLVLNGHAAYRTQLFLYLKACGREELSTMNLWAGVDAPATV